MAFPYNDGDVLSSDEDKYDSHHSDDEDIEFDKKNQRKNER